MNTSTVMQHNYFMRVLVLILLLTWAVSAQAPQQPSPQAPPAQAAPSIRPNYVLGPNDQLLIRAPQAEEINDRPFRIDADGFITLPVVGRVRASGLTVQGLEAEITRHLREYIREPLVTITVVQFRSEPVFLVGAFRSPGIYPLEGRTLVEMLAAAGGLQPNAGRRIRLTRRNEYGDIPLSNAVEDPDRKVSTVEIGLESLSQTINPAEDIPLKPYDIITVDRAEMIYVTGEVLKAGGIELAERDSMSVSQALSMAGGFAPAATRNKVRVLRPILDTNRRAEIEIDMKRVFEGKDPDFPLLPNDVLFVPRSSGRAFLTTAGASMLISAPYIIVTAILR